LIVVVRGELAEARTAAILRPVTAEWTAVNPAMRRLEIAAGPELEEQCRRLGELPVGSAVITPAGALVASLMVHVAVRSVDEPVTEAGVRRALRNGLRRLAEWRVRTVALPPLGTGAGNLDAEASAEVMMPLLAAHIAEGAAERVEIVVDSEYELDVFRRSAAPRP
jgi:O-acetyl-ADP-ribose deacetylase (regulator of RNase III)